MSIGNLKRVLLKILIKLKYLYNINIITRGFIITILCYIFRVIQIKLYRRYHSLPNGPFGIPILGCALQQFFLGDFIWYQKVAKYGKVVSYQNYAVIITLLLVMVVVRVEDVGLDTYQHMYLLICVAITSNTILIQIGNPIHPK